MAAALFLYPCKLLLLIISYFFVFALLNVLMSHLRVYSVHDDNDLSLLSHFFRPNQLGKAKLYLACETIDLYELFLLCSVPILYAL
jgi:hypothetical protein